MNSLRLFPSAPPISPLCLGAATFGREIDEAAAFAFMDHALARGVTLIDTAAAYSAGASEKIVGAWLASRQPAPDRLMVATKLFPPFTAATIDETTALCAARLGVETIDVLYLHKWDATAETPEALRALDLLVRDGRVRALGASNFNPAQFQTALALQQRLGLARFRILQNNNNLAVRDIDGPLRALCAAHDVAIVTYSPLGAGFLTGKHRGGVEAGSRFAIVPGHQNVYFNPTAEARLTKLDAVANRTGHSMTHLALAWALHHAGVTSVLVGGRGPAHLDQAFSALELNSPALFAELESV